LSPKDFFLKIVQVQSCTSLWVLKLWFRLFLHRGQLKFTKVNFKLLVLVGGYEKCRCNIYPYSFLKVIASTNPVFTIVVNLIKHLLVNPIYIGGCLKPRASLNRELLLRVSLEKQPVEICISTDGLLLFMNLPTKTCLASTNTFSSRDNNGQLCVISYF